MHYSHAQLSHVTVDEAKKTVHVLFTPTVPHCSASTLIGLSIRYPERENPERDFFIAKP